MYLRNALVLFLGVSLFGLPGVSQAPPPASSQAAVTGGTRVHGTILDPDGELIPGATITMTPAHGNAIKATSGSDGTYSVTVPSGSYTLLVTMPGFAAYSVVNLKVPAVSATTIDATLKVGDQTQVINVDSEALQLSVDPDNNPSTTIITGKDLDALSDDPDELSSELTALAGPSAGPNGGQIYVDGFTGGQLPPKSSIREIRVNQNPFSAEYDKLGYGRIEVFTKPGTDKFHGSAQVNGNANFLNTSNPFLGNVPQDPYHTLFLLLNLTGPLTKKSSFSTGGSYRDIQANQIFNGTLLATAVNATAPCPPGTVAAPSPCGPFPSVVPIFQPQTRYDFTPRVDVQVTPKNTLTIRYQLEHSSETNAGTGTFTLQSAGDDTAQTENTLQMTDAQTISQNIINETRFEYQRDLSSTTPFGTGPTFSVGSSFTGGNSSAQTTHDHQDHFEVQNYTSIQLKNNFVRLGGRFRSTRDAQYSNSGSNGQFSYTCVTITAACSADQNGVISAYSIGQASQFSITQINQGSVLATLADLGLYAEDDWKAKKNLTVSYGLRYETQNHMSDHHDFAPRLSVAWGLGSKKGSPQTVIRAGFGLFYERFALGNVLNTLQDNGTNQLPFIVTDPTDACTSIVTCHATASNSLETYALAPNLRSAIITQSAVGLDEQLGKIGTISINYQNAHGTHEFNSLDATLNGSPQIINGVAAPFSYQYQSEGLFNQNQISFAPRIQVGRRISISGYYVLNFAKSDTGGAGSFPSVPTELRDDYGRATFDTRHRVFLFGNFSLPHLITFSPLLSIASGSPFNIYTGTDLNNDGVLSNDRPAFATSATVKPVVTKYGTFDINPTPGEARIPINLGTGPSQVVMNLRVLKTIGFGPSTSTQAQGGGGDRGNRNGPPGGPPGGPGGGPGGRGGGGGGGGRGGGPGGFGGGASSGKRYNLSFGVSVANLFNDVDLAAPIGNLSSPQFGKSTQLAGGFATSVNAVRRITLQTSFTF